PVAGMPLVSLLFNPQNITTGIETLRQMDSLQIIGLDGVSKWPAAHFWKKYDAGDFRKPAAPAKKLAYTDPAFQKWVADPRQLPPEQQIEAVSKKLMELNPGFDGAISGRLNLNIKTPKIEKGVVTEVGILCLNVTDLSPVQAFPGLNSLSCTGGPTVKGKLTD